MIINNENFKVKEIPGREYYVYVYYDENKIPFYVGIGKGNRITNHLRTSVRKERPTLFYNKLNKMISNNIPFSYIKIRSELSLLEAKCSEEVLIKLIGRRDTNSGTLCNLTDGGEGHKGYIKSEELKRRISDWSRGKKLSEKQIEAIKLCNTGRKHSMETRKKLSIIQKGTKKPKSIESIPNYIKAARKKLENPEYIKNLKENIIKFHGKKVAQLSLQGEIVKIWDNQIEAAKLLNGRGDRILDVCRGKRIKHKNFKWKFIE